MFEYLTIGFTLISCGLIFFQDLRSRAVHWVLFPLLCVGCVLLGSATTSVSNWGYNAAFLVVLLGSLTLYLTLKYKRFVLITDGFFSWGDILFLLAVIPFFELQDYMFFFTIGTCVVLLIHVLLHVCKPQKSVPFAGYMALLFGIQLMFNLRIHQIIVSFI